MALAFAGTAAPVPLMFQSIAGSLCGALLPTGNAVDVVEGVEATLIDPREISPSQIERAGALLDRANAMPIAEAGEDYGSHAMLALSAVSASRSLSASAEETVERARAAAARRLEPFLTRRPRAP